jgi:hypothetical protein
MYEIVPLNSDHLDALLAEVTGLRNAELARAYFSPGSAALCLLADGKPVFAGGVVNLMWHRGEAWILPTPFFREHVRVCMKALRATLPDIARKCGFERIQATCVQGVSSKLFLHLGFAYEGTLRKFGPNGETCTMYSRIMGEA